MSSDTTGYLTHHAALMSANALLGSQLDYCYSLFRSLTALDLRKLQCVQNSLSRIVTNTTECSHITPAVCQLNSILYSRLPYWSISSYTVVIQNADGKLMLMVCSSRSHTLPLQYISLLSILVSALLLMLQRITGTICLTMYCQSLLSTHSRRSSKPISLDKHIHPNFCISWYLSLALTPAMSQVNDY